MEYLLHHLLSKSNNIDSSKEAVVYNNDRLSYAMVDELSNRLANALINADLKRGERVGIILDKNIDCVISIFAVSKAGGVFVPINPLLFPEQIGHIINDCTIKALIIDGKKLKSIQKVLLEGRSDSVNFIITNDKQAIANVSKNQISLNEVFTSESSSQPHNVCISNDLAAILYTSGSTGKPKGVMLSHANLLAGSHIVSTYLNINDNDRILGVLPFSFDYGLNQLLTAFHNCGTIVLLSFRFPDEVVQALVKERISGLAGVPPFWNLLTQPSSSIYRHKFKHLRYITNSGGIIPQTLLKSMRKAMPTADVYLMYGLTEAFRSTYLAPHELERKPTSIGKAIHDTEIYVINDKGEHCKTNEIGELVHRGPTVSLGYWGQPEATNMVLRPNPFLTKEFYNTEKVCYSGDLVRKDEEGFLYFVARRDTTIKSSGYRISPTEVEDIFYSSGLIHEVAVIGVPDEVLGQYVKAFAVPHSNVNSDTAKDELIQYCIKKMPRYMIPREISIVFELPKTGNGKINYQILSKREDSETK